MGLLQAVTAIHLCRRRVRKPVEGAEASRGCSIKSLAPKYQLFRSDAAGMRRETTGVKHGCLWEDVWVEGGREDRGGVVKFQKHFKTSPKLHEQLFEADPILSKGVSYLNFTPVIPFLYLFIYKHNIHKARYSQLSSF